MNPIGRSREDSFTIILLSICILFPLKAFGQATSESRPILFIDCSNCDYDYLKTEFQFIDYARDRLDANIHVLVTTISNSGGGSEYTLSLTGSGPFQGLSDEVRFYSEKYESDDAKRVKLVHHIRLGLVRYLVRTPMKEQLSVSVSPFKNKRTEKEDPWDHWIFTINFSGGLSGQSSTNSLIFTPKLNIDRVTEDWRIFFEFYYTYDKDSYDVEEGEVSTLTTRKDSKAYFIKSVSDHWSFGLFNKLNASTYENIDFYTRIRPVIEYNLFPYRDATKKQLRINYGIGPEYFDYIEETIFDKTQELVFQQKLDVTVDINQPWGYIQTTAAGENYLHDINLFRLDISPSLSLQLFYGFSLNFSATVSLIRDQINLPKSGATDEEILLQLRELESDYGYSTNVGLAYAFGSKVSNIVNPRFGF